MIAFVRMFLAAVFLLVGVSIMVISTVGVNRFHYVLNRMHAAAVCDTLGIMLVLIGLIIHNGPTLVSAKLALIIVFFWMASPVCSHLISNLEIHTNPDYRKECEIVDD